MFTLDYSTDRGRVRLLIGDIDAAAPIFDDTAVDAFLDTAADNNVKRAAALALRVIAVNEILVQKRIRTLDLSTDGPAEAKELRELAALLDAQADAEEVDGAFDWAELVLDPATFSERIYKEGQRNGTW